ncbi:MAG: hypothetical protein Q9222_006185 [Ikaeria aurantiellina]
MSLLGRMFADDEELGKKDDDRKPGKISLQLPAWSARKPALWRRRRTLLYCLIACVTLYIFFKNIPSPDHPPIARPTFIRPPRDTPHNAGNPKAIPEDPSQKPPWPDKPTEIDKHYYDGPIRFERLAVSLHAISRLRGHVESNRNVLFASSNLRSASELIPIACEMGSWEKNDVHFAFMGRDDLELDELRVLNGVDDDCKVNWHDARPDFSPWSSDFRMEVSVFAGLGHINDFMHPQVLLMDDPSREDGFFSKAIRAKALELSRPVIELPTDASENLMWITRLDSSSLMGLIWPPLDWSGIPHASQVTLRHRIPRQKSTAEEASVRLLESFYPARPADSHILVLSPQVELSPLYFHFLTHQLLEYRYSSSARENAEKSKLMGLSLELPYMHLNDTTPFSPPMRTSESRDSRKAPEKPTPFLWQAPNSNAALYFGDKWIEFHSFLSSRMSHEPTTTLNRPKMISDTYPSWLEYALELMRARGYTLLYPNFSSSNREAIASLHTEHFQPPEEYTPDPKQTKSSSDDEPIPVLDPHETFETDASTQHPSKPSPHRESTPLTTTLTALLPASKTFSTSLSDLPLLTYQGNLEPDPLTFESVARIFAMDFRRSIGRCQPSITLKRPEIEPMSADDLFCDGDDRGGLSLGELPRRDEGSRGSMTYVGREKLPLVPDDSEVRQAEFEAHLSRQGERGGKDKGEEKGKDEGDDEVEGEEEDGGEKKGKGKDEAEKKKEDKEGEEKPQVRDRGW